jgi:hypothetical protein
VSGTHISAALRRAVIARAERCCEYCLIHDDDTFYGCEVDHIISEKHGGATAASAARRPAARSIAGGRVRLGRKEQRAPWPAA